jgi:ATP-dependent Clp protease adaptor protein ClpS
VSFVSPIMQKIVWNRLKLGTEVQVLMSDEEDQKEFNSDSGLLLEEEKPKLKRPPLFKVVILNDDYTPMEFVIEILEQFFSMNREKATQIMLAIHTQGKAVVGIYPRDIAETKSHLVNQYAKEHEHPLLSDIEPVSDDDEE